MERIQSPRQFNNNIARNIAPRRFPTEAEQHSNGIRGTWIPGTGENEFSVGGHTVQWGWFPQTGYKCYYDSTDDMFITHSQFEALCGRR